MAETLMLGALLLRASSNGRIELKSSALAGRCNDKQRIDKNAILDGIMKLTLA
jgi:hypothetical protein